MWALPASNHRRSIPFAFWLALTWVVPPILGQDPGTLPHWEGLSETERKYLGDVGGLDAKTWAAPSAGPEDSRKPLQ